MTAAQPEPQRDRRWVLLAACVGSAAISVAGLWFAGCALVDLYQRFS